MSRNFELLSRIEKEGKTGKPTFVEASAVPARARVAPVTENSPLPEILQLVQRVFLCGNGSAPRQVMFSGVDNGQGSSAVCAQVARVLAEKVDRPVCVVDANPNPSRLSSIFGLENTSDLDRTIREQCVRVHGSLWLAGLAVLKNRAATLPGTDLKTRLAELRSGFEFVLIDAPPANNSADAAVIGQFVDAAILVVEADQTRRASAKHARDLLADANVRLLGTVLNNRSFPIPESVYRKL